MIFYSKKKKTNTTKAVYDIMELRHVTTCNMQIRRIERPEMSEKYEFAVKVKDLKSLNGR